MTPALGGIASPEVALAPREVPTPPPATPAADRPGPAAPATLDPALRAPPAVRRFRLPRGPRRTLAALAETVMPPLPGGGPHVEYVVRFVELTVACMTPWMRLLAPWSLVLFEWATIVFARTFRPFSRLPLDRRRAYLDGWLASPSFLRRNIVKGFVGLAMFGYYDHPRVRAHIGFQPEEHARQAAARRKERHGL